MLSNVITPKKKCEIFVMKGTRVSTDHQIHDKEESLNLGNTTCPPSVREALILSLIENKDKLRD